MLKYATRSSRSSLPRARCHQVVASEVVCIESPRKATCAGPRDASIGSGRGVRCLRYDPPLMEAAWRGFLQGTGPAAHAVQVYRDVEELADSVAKYLAVGFDLGEPAIVIATPEHWASCGERLAESGWNAERIEQSGLLFSADADSTLAAIMEGGRPAADRFDAVVGGLLDRAGARFPDRRIRAFGEMV